MIDRRAIAAGLGLACLAAMGAPDVASAGHLPRRGSMVTRVLPPIAVAMCTYGQSNAGTSNGSDLPVSTTNGAPAAAPWSNLEYRTSAFAPAYSNTGAANTEELCFGALNQLSTWYPGGTGSRIRGACQENAVGSQSYAQLADGTANWTNQWAECAGMRSAYAAAFPDTTSAPTPLVVWLQGETDQVLGTSRATYVANLNTLWTDVCAEFSGAPWSLGAACPQIYMIPYAGVTRLGQPGTATLAERSEIVLAHYEACRDNPERFVCAHPGYASTMVTANEHYDAEGYRTNGAQLARVFRERALLGVDWRMLRPDPATLTCTDNVVTVPIVGGSGTGLTVDTTAVTRRPHLGFEYTDDGADPATIQHVTVVGESVLLTLSRGCTSGARVRYAAAGGPTCNAGRTGTCGTGGNIRRSTCADAYWGGETLCDWLMPFDQAVATVSSTPDLGRPFADTGIVSRAPTSVSWFDARASAVTDGVADMSVSAWMLTPASFAANQVIVERWGASGARNFSIRTESTGRLSIFLSGDGSTINQTCNTPNNVLTVNTWTHVAIVKSGTTLTPYVNAVATNCSGTGSAGTTPATMSNGRSSPITWGGSVPGTNNLSTPIAHVAVWARALSLAEVGQLTTATPMRRPLDPRPLAPAHYWPSNGFFDDLGTAAARPAHHYGTASYVETASLFGASDSGHAFGATGAGVLDGAQLATLRLDVTMPAASLPQEGTVIERDDASSANRQIGVAITAAGQVTVRVADALTGTGQWPADAGRDECTTVGTLATSTRYRILVRYDGTQASNATRLRVWWSTVASTADPDATAYATLGAPVEQTCTFTGTIPSTLTTPASTGWSVGRRTAALNINGLRNAQLNANAVAIWAGVAADPTTQVESVLRAPDVYNTPLRTPSLVFRARGPGMVETQALGASTPSGATTLVYVPTGEWSATSRRGGYPLAFINTLSEPGRTLLGATQSAGASPWSITPSNSAPGWTETGIDAIVYQDGTLTYPIVTGAQPDTITLVSAAEAAGPAGLFTAQTSTQSPPRAFDPAVGFAVETCNAVTPNTIGVRGGVLALSRNFGAGFEPEGLDMGYVHDSTRDPATSGWQWCTYGSCTDLGVLNAPRDGRLYCALIAVEAGVCSGGAPCAGYALLVDMAVPNGPRIVDQRSFDVTSPDSLFLEINASCCSVTGDQRTMVLWKAEGNRQYSGALLLLPMWRWRRREDEDERRAA